MKYGCIAKLGALFGCLAVFLVTLTPAGALVSRLAAPDRCPPGQTPRRFVHPAEVILPADVLPYSKMSLSRITLQPGETLDFTPAGFTAFYVEAGALKYRADRPGFAIMDSELCESPDGHFSGGGSFTIDNEGMALVT